MCGDKSTPNLFRTFKMRKNILCSSLRLLGFAVQCAQDSLYAKALRCPVCIRQLMCKSISTRSRNGGTQESDILVLTDSKQNHVAVVPWMHSQYTAQALPNIRFTGSTPVRALSLHRSQNGHTFCILQALKNMQGAATAACNGYQSG